MLATLLKTCRTDKMKIYSDLDYYVVLRHTLFVYKQQQAQASVYTRCLLC